jgi:hypothetical protein
MRRQTPMQVGTAVLSLLLASCMPAFTKRNNEPANPVVEKDHAADFELLKSVHYASLRGAGANEVRDSDAWRRRAIANALATDYIRRNEGPMYRRRDASEATDGLPQMCLALSGGGMRALAFGAGVLYGLQQRGLYSRINVVSGVSGGGYTSYWMIGSVDRGGSEAEVLSGPDSSQLTHLRRHAGDLSSVSTATLFLGSMLAYSNQQQGLAMPLAQVLATATGNVAFFPAPGQAAYEAALDHMLLGGSMLLTMHSRMLLSKLREHVQSGHVPIPVWLATAMPAGDAECVDTSPAAETDIRSRSLLFSAFEMGPTGLGSNTLGYLTHMRLPPVAALAISGAAMGIPYNQRCQSMHMIDASMRIENFPARSDPMELPSTGHRLPPTDAPFVLTDGAIADNLGVFPLVRRLCSDIIVVDAGFDPYLTFESYGYLKQQLARLDIDIDIPALEKIAAKNRIPPDPRNPTVPCRDGICLIRPRAECVHRDAAAGCIASDELPTAVFEGQIRAIPIASRISLGASSGAQDGSWTFDERALHVRYVKLSLDDAHIDVYPATVRARYAEDVQRSPSAGGICESQRDTGACRFPHKPTIDLDFRGGKFEAYWDLARCIMERNWDAGEAADPAKHCSDSRWPL